MANYRVSAIMESTCMEFMMARGSGGLPRLKSMQLQSRIENITEGALGDGTARVIPNIISSYRTS